MVSVAAHLSKAPLIATEAFTKKLMLLFSGVTAKTGASARLSNGRAADSIRGRTANRMVLRLILPAHLKVFFVLGEPYPGHTPLRVELWDLAELPSGNDVDLQW
jgi:hypothetical protein